MYCQPFLTSYLTWPFGKTLNCFFWLGLASEELQYSLMWNLLLFLCKNDRNIFDMSAFKKDIIEKIHKHSMDNCSCIIRKINPIICLLLEVQGLLYQTLILQFSKWDIPILFYEPGNCTPLPDSLHRTVQNASRQQKMDGLQTRLEKTTNEPAALWPP